MSTDENSNKTILTLKTCDGAEFEIKKEAALQSKTDENSNKKMLTLKSSDNAVFEIEQEAALQSQTILHLVEDGLGENAIPLQNVNGAILAKVIEYLKKHVKSSESNDDEKSLKEFDKEFMDVERDVLFDLILAANYLYIKSLLDLACQAAADMIKDMTVEECRTFFNIVSDFTEEEEKAIRKEHEWAFDV